MPLNSSARASCLAINLSTSPQSQEQEIAAGVLDDFEIPDGSLVDENGTLLIDTDGSFLTGN